MEVHALGQVVILLTEAWISRCCCLDERMAIGMMNVHVQYRKCISCTGMADTSWFTRDVQSTRPAPSFHCGYDTVVTHTWHTGGYSAVPDSTTLVQDWA